MEDAMARARTTDVVVTPDMGLECLGCGERQPINIRKPLKLAGYIMMAQGWETGHTGCRARDATRPDQLALPGTSAAEARRVPPPATEPTHDEHLAWLRGLRDQPPIQREGDSVLVASSGRLRAWVHVSGEVVFERWGEMGGWAQIPAGHMTPESWADLRAHGRMNADLVEEEPPSAAEPSALAAPAAPASSADAAPGAPPAAEYRPAVCFSIATADYTAHEDVLTWEGHDQIAFSWEPDDTGARFLGEPIEVLARAEVLRKQLAAVGVAAEEIAIPAPRPSGTHVVFVARLDAWRALPRSAQDKLRSPIKTGRRKANEPDQARWAVSCWPIDVHDEGRESLIATAPIELGPIADAVRATAADLGLPLREQPAPVWTCRRCNADVLATYDPMTYGRLCAGGVCDDCTTKAVRAYRERDRAARAVDAEKRKPGRKSKAKAPPPAEQPTVPVPTAAAPEPAAEPVTICMALADWERITDDNATAGALTCSTEQTEIEWHIDGTTDGKDTVSDPLSGEDLEQVRRVLGAAGVGWIEKGPTTFRTVPPRDPKPSKKSRATPAAPPFAEVLKHDDPLEVARTSKNAHVLVVKEPGEKWLRVLSGTSKPGMRTAFEERAGIFTNGEHAGTELRWYHREQLVDRTIGTSTPGAEGTDATTAAEPAEAVS
jgi:hypothetical protein